MPLYGSSGASIGRPRGSCETLERRPPKSRWARPSSGDGPPEHRGAHATPKAEQRPSIRRLPTAGASPFSPSPSWPNRSAAGPQSDGRPCRVPPTGTPFRSIPPARSPRRSLPRLNDDHGPPHVTPTPPPPRRQHCRRVDRVRHFGPAHLECDQNIRRQRGPRSIRPAATVSPGPWCCGRAAVRAQLPVQWERSEGTLLQGRLSAPSFGRRACIGNRVGHNRNDAPEHVPIRDGQIATSPMS